MIGLSKELLEETYKALLADYGAHPNDSAIKTCLESLLSRCEELDPWLPIDDNTPKDRYILIFDGVVKSKVVAKFDAAIGLYLDRGRVAVYATHYKELDPCLPIEDAPKDRYIRVFAPAYNGLPLADLPAMRPRRILS